MPSLLAKGKEQYFDNAGLPLSGGKLYTYTAGTSIPRATYADNQGLVPNANPVILDSRGEAVVFWSGTYKVVLKDANDNIIWTVDNVAESGLASRTSTTGSEVVPAGTTAQRDVAPINGYFRYNVDLGCYEGYFAAGWKSFPKSVNGVSVPDGGDVVLKTVGGVGIVGAGDVAVQAPLVSGTNIKTVNGSSLLGAGNIIISSLASIPRTPRTANTILSSSDAGTLIDVTSGTFTQTLTAAATLGANWSCYYKNSGTGTVTIDPNGAELIDGLTTGTVTPGMVILIQCNGAAFFATRVGGQTVIDVRTSGTSWVAPLGVRQVKVRGVGAGASGSTSSNTVTAGGGGGGAYFEKMVSVVPGTAYTYVVGAGGAGISGTGTVGNTGGSTTFNDGVTTYTAAGGSPSAAVNGSSGAGGNATNGDLNITGGLGYFVNSTQSMGGSSVLGPVNLTGAAFGYGNGSAGGTQSGSSVTAGSGVLILEY